MGTTLKPRKEEQERTSFPEMNPRLLAIYAYKKGLDFVGATETPPPRVQLREPDQMETVPADPSRVFVAQTEEEKEILRKTMQSAFTQTPLEKDIVMDFLIVKSYELAADFLCRPKEERTSQFLKSLIPRSRQNPKILGRDDAEVIRDGIAIFLPIFGHFVTQKR